DSNPLPVTATNPFNVLAPYKLILYVDQPILGAPHAFIQLLKNIPGPPLASFTGDKTQVFGFGLGVTVNADGGSIWDDFTIGAIGQQYPHPWDWRLVFTLTSQQYINALNFVYQQVNDPPTYNLLSSNCMSWAVQVAHEAGVTIPASLYTLPL